MQPDRIRLSEFAAWIGESKPVVRGLLVRSEVPFDPETGDGSQRTYDGADLLAWCLFTQLRRIGLTPRTAAGAIRHSAAVSQFFKAQARGDQISDLHLIFWIVRRGREGRAPFEVQNQTIDTSDAAAGIMKQEALSYGAATHSGDTGLGLVSMVTVPLLPCLHRCQKTVAAHGFEMRGAELFEV